MYAYKSSFTDRVSQLLERVDYRVAETVEQREEIYRLRYEAYRREQSIEPNDAELFYDDYDELDNVQIFGLYVEDRLVSSIRIHVASQDQPRFPSRATFADLLDPELAAGKVIIDPTRFVTDRDVSQSLTGLPHLTLRLCWMAAQHYDADHFLVAIRTEHQAFYRRTFNHRLICPERPYPMLKAPISLMTLRHSDVADKVHRRYPFFASTAFERQRLFGQSSRQLTFAEAS